MACPHSFIGLPEECSQCLGVKPERVEYDAATGRMLVDGVLQERSFTPTVAETANESQRRGGRRRGRVRRVKKL